MDLIVLGAGGNSLDIVDAATACGHRCLGLLDDDSALWGSEVYGLPVLGGLDAASRFPQARFISGIHGIGLRTRKADILARTGLSRERFASVIHPRAAVSPTARIGLGAAVLANATLCARVELGDHAIVLPGAVLNHDVVVGAYTAVAAGACLSGQVSVGDSAYIGSGALVRERLRIGERAVVGMGAVVVRDVPADTVVAGCPARPLTSGSAATTIKG